MAEKLSVSEKFNLLRTIGRLRAQYWHLSLKEWRALLKGACSNEVIKIRARRERVRAEIDGLRKKYDEEKVGRLR